MEETLPDRRTVPSSFTLLKAEFGYVGTRRNVLDCARDQAKEGFNASLEHQVPQR